MSLATVFTTVTFLLTEMITETEIIDPTIIETTRTPSYYVDEDYPARPEIQQLLPE